MFAVLNVYKPLELTSHDVVARLRKVYQLKKIGHLGTLDPLAEGVLPVCLGQATRLIEYFPSDKQYIAEVTFGITTDTLDRAGQILTQTPCSDFSAERLQQLLPRFIGSISQRVPLHSAVHIQGKKLYEYAHKGQVVETPTKTVTIYGIDLLSLSGLEGEHPVATLRVDCGSGTYIRALARDLGEALGCGAYMSKLVRTQHGRFSQEQAVGLADLQTSQDPHSFLEDPATYLDLPILELSCESSAKRLTQGMQVPLEELGQASLLENQHCLLRFNALPLGIGRVEASRIQPVKIFAARG